VGKSPRVLCQPPAAYKSCKMLRILSFSVGQKTAYNRTVYAPRLRRGRRRKAARATAGTLCEIPITIIFIGLSACDFILIGTGFYDVYDVISKVFSIYPVRDLAVSLTFYFFCLIYCIFYIGILLFVLNKILLKLKNLIIIFILTFLTFLFGIVLVSSWPAHYLGDEYFFNYPVLGRLFWELRMPYWDFIRLIYSIFYAVFLLLVFNIKILKSPLKIIFSVILLATITNLFWIIEILARGWRGLYWLTYIHIALFITGIMFLFWLVFVNKNNKANNYKIDIIFYGVLYTLFLLIFIVLFKMLFRNVNDHHGLDYSFSKYRMHYGFIFLQAAVIFAFNILVMSLRGAELRGIFSFALV
jgi:hypothetical protein